MAFAGVSELLDAIAAGRMVVLVDDEDRENEGDLVMAADCVRPEDINFMAREGRGLICLALTAERCRELRLPPMVSDNRSRHGTAFTVSIEAAAGVTTGISAHDRAHTIRTAVALGARSSDLHQPGHVFPLAAQAGGVLVRPGHTEAAVDLARLAGRFPAGVIVEILGADGRMARRPELEQFAQAHRLPIGSIADLIQYRKSTEAPATHCYSAVSASGFESFARMSGIAGFVDAGFDPAASPLPTARFAVVAARFNGAIVERLLAGAGTAFASRGIADTDVEVFHVPGAWEIPLAAAHLARSQRFAGMVALGCVVRGDTRHFEHIADECARGLMQLQVASGVPIGNAVLAVDRIEDAEARAIPGDDNKGYQATLATIEAAALVARIK